MSLSMRVWKIGPSGRLFLHSLPPAVSPPRNHLRHRPPHLALTPAPSRVRWWYRLTFAESSQLVDGVGCPGDWVLDSIYCYWHVGDSVPHCVLNSAPPPANLSAVLSDCHVTDALVQTPSRCWAIVTVVVDLTLSAVHQWVGH